MVLGVIILEKSSEWVYAGVNNKEVIDKSCCGPGYSSPSEAIKAPHEKLPSRGHQRSPQCGAYAVEIVY